MLQRLVLLPFDIPIPLFGLILLGLFLAAFVIYANVRRWHDLNRMTPSQRKEFKQQEREDLWIW